MSNADQSKSEEQVTDLSSFTDEQLLAELLRRNPPQPGPRSMHFAELPAITSIGIGKDHHASIVIGPEDMAALRADPSALVVEVLARDEPTASKAIFDPDDEITPKPRPKGPRS